MFAAKHRQAQLIRHLFAWCYHCAENDFELSKVVPALPSVTGTYNLTYDNMGRLTQASTVYSFLAGKTFAVSYTYDADSNRTGLTDPNGSSTSYTYDALNRLASLKDFKRNSFTFAYDALSRTTKLVRPNAVSSTYQYDAVSNLLSVLHQNGTVTLDGATYSYDPAGNRASKTNSLNNVTSNFAYDNLYQLTGVTQGTSTVESYTYDAAGNRLSSIGSSSYSYNASNELLGAGPASYTYDDNGNTLTKTDSGGTITYAWDFENRLRSVTLPGGTSVTFQYDPLGRRIQKGSSIFVYDGSNLIQESDSSGNLVARYIQGPGIDQPLAAYRGAASEFYEADGLGSITSLTTTAGALNQSYVFDSFGNASSTTGTFVQPFQYTGRERDAETGLYYYRARYYDASTGRFLSEDPSWPSGDPNEYVYAKADPVNRRDPSGLKTYVIIIWKNAGMDDFLGEHAALYIDNGGHPILFDPGADTVPVGGGEHPANDIFEIPDFMTLTDYIMDDRREHLYTEIIPFDTDSATEAAIVKRIRDLTKDHGVRPTFCARAVSEVLNGVGPFRDLGTFRRPSALARRLRRLKGGTGR